MNVLQTLQKKSFRQFMDGRPGPWGALTVGLFGVRTLWRWSRRTPEVVYRGTLEPGESIQITNTDDTEVSLKRDRKKAKKTAKKAARQAKRNAPSRAERAAADRAAKKAAKAAKRAAKKLDQIDDTGDDES